MRYEFIKEHRSSYPVVKMCPILKVSVGGYYRWLKAPISKRALEREAFEKRVAELFEEHAGMAGSPMIHDDLREEEQWRRVSVNRVARTMKKLGLRSKVVRKFVATTDSGHAEPVAPNILQRNFTVPAPNQVWVSDITYLRVGRKWHYLTVFLDLYSRMVVGWDLSTSLKRQSLMQAFSKAWWKRKPSKGLLIHSDRGVQYASKDFRRQLKMVRAQQSMSRKGNCWDNAVAESFFHTLKTSYLYHQRFKTIEEAQAGLFWYIEMYYNRRRKHSSNGRMTPARVEELFWKEKEVA